MIKSLKISNLQSHKSSALEFSSGVNVIVGKSRQGKTSIIRAIRKVVENRPIIGIERWVHKHDQKNIIAIEMATSDGHSVVWKNTNPQVYIVDGSEYKGFGQNVPEQVSQTLNLGQINIAHQFDQPFLIFDSPGEVARFLNSVVHLDVIDVALGNINSLKRQNDHDTRNQQVRIDELNEARKSFPDLEAVEEIVSGLESLNDEKAKRQATMNRLSFIQESVKNLHSKLAATVLPTWLYGIVEDLIKKNDYKGQLELTKMLLSKIQTNYKNLKTQLDSLLSLMEMEPTILRLVVANSEFTRLKKGLARLRGIQEKISALQRTLSEKLSLAEQAENEFRESFPQQCPLCGAVT